MHLLQVQSQLAASSHFTDKTDQKAIFRPGSRQHPHSCLCLCMTHNDAEPGAARHLRIDVSVATHIEF